MICRRPNLIDQRYNLVNQLATMQGRVDIVRLSPQPSGTLDWLVKFKANLAAKAPQPLSAGDSKGYWLNLAGMATG